MKVTLINTSDAGGGAPVASMRLLKALASENIEVNFLAGQKKTSETRVQSVENNWLSRLKARFNFLYERLPFIFFQEKDKSVRFAFSTASAGTSISNQPLVKDADILHLHWTNSGFLSIKDLKELIQLGKPIVWTLHDMWTFTGGCHYAGTCDHFTGQCGDCYFLRNPNQDDISHTGWLRKQNLYAKAQNISFVTCSNWLASVASQSSLLKKFPIQAIPNPIDIEVYSPQDKMAARAKWKISPNSKVILFGAANIGDRRKGITYLVQALKHLKQDYEQPVPVEVLIFGKNKHFDVSQLPFPVHALNTIRSQQDLTELYSLADVFVMPSIEDNLPNTVMESMACGTPVVAFNIGGLPEMIEHQQNGYLAEFKSATDLAKGIHEMLFTDHAMEIATQARNKVLQNFTHQNIARKYIKVYQSLLSK
ncbi:glycosyl transferase group 1 [Pedobacter sp. HMWF019]|uniref:glycosyltransferase family 4 protein n=1 Tax=Pedobacter sp. HMWF019 TaxID=2056856 RepID=UPI000D3C9F1F|nr:glycosyltransferase family 4 protein [Pedobacter sp. HMWF019]PTT03088.1 glycosyl transferase group 1 [Pedobacter sp. HMWF019]